jgi:hypothetical protein
MDPDVLWRLDLMVGSRAVVPTQILTFTHFSLLIPSGMVSGSPSAKKARLRFFPLNYGSFRCSSERSAPQLRPQMQHAIQRRSQCEDAG